MKELNRGLAYNFRELNQEQFEMFLKAILKDNKEKEWNYDIFNFEIPDNDYDYFYFYENYRSWIMGISSKNKHVKLTSALELFKYDKPKQCTPEKILKEIVKPDQYRIGIDTIERSKANLTPENILAICQFQIDKYTWREKDQDIEDFQKVIYYANWAIKTLNSSKTND